MKTIRFIINPHSGVWMRRNLKIRKAIERYLDSDLYSYEIMCTERAGHAIEMSRDCSEDGIDIAVVVGGDGSVNEVSSSLLHSSTMMGIIPAGSGNGLARFLEIPMNAKKAIEIINRAKIKTIDTATINGKTFVNCAGIGYDAYIAHKFGHSRYRGALTYLGMTAAQLIKYKPEKYILEIDGKSIEREAFLISISNSSQYGNNVYIAPKALSDDGLLDIVIIKPFPFFIVFEIAYRLLVKSIMKSKYVECYRGRHIIVRCQGHLCVHMDGEPVKTEGDLEIKVNPLSLKVIVK
ncbi:MAG: diacylglycerol kinase family lipid kinase [Bacteroidia bacterium]|nr:diacylglycerol kinase family lipid kinase [Bacteroidia bacterium]